jgi:predicted dehydrogenase
MGYSGEVRIGIIGAGEVARSRHLPGFQAIPGVRVVGVCNRRRESSGRIAREFDVPKTYATWEHLIEDDDVDAVVIGTWPYLHGPITLAALDAGKHVLAESRMAMNAREAQRMLDRSLECPHLASMVVPSPYGLAGDAFVRSLIADGYLGTLREVHITGLSGDLADPSSPLGWRQVTKYSGFNMLQLGVLHESAMRWTPPVKRVIASASKQVPVRLDPETGEPARVGTPDSVQVLTSYQGGARGTYRLSGVVLHSAGSSIVMFGSKGTLVYDFKRDELRGARRNELDLRPIPIPDELRGGWRVEADFVAAIRGERLVDRTTFTDGVRSMQFTEAVARSSRHQAPVDLPLAEFSNPSL